MDDIHPFEAAISVVGVIVGGIITLTLFFYLMGWISRRSNATRMPFKGVIGDTTRATVHLTGGKKFEDVRITGFTDGSSPKGGFPYELSGMVILEHADGRRTMIRAKLIRMIELPARR